MKVLSLNIQQFGETHGPWHLRRELVVAAIAAADADIVALQAVASRPDEDGGTDQAAQLASRLDRHTHLVREAVPYRNGTIGNAILARIPPLQFESLPLSLRAGIEDEQRRLVLRVAFDFGRDVLQVFNCHFSWVPEQCADNVREMLSWTARFPGPRLIVGDMNAQPRSAPFRAIAAAGFVDAWSLLNPGLPGATFPADLPTRRIDYVWCDTGAAKALRSAEIVGRPAPPPDACASDHLGLMVGFEL